MCVYQANNHPCDCDPFHHLICPCKDAYFYLPSSSTQLSPSSSSVSTSGDTRAGADVKKPYHNSDATNNENKMMVVVPCPKRIFVNRGADQGRKELCQLCHGTGNEDGYGMEEYEVWDEDEDEGDHDEEHHVWLEYAASQQQQQHHQEQQNLPFPVYSSPRANLDPRPSPKKARNTPLPPQIQKQPRFRRQSTSVPTLYLRWKQKEAVRVKREMAMKPSWTFGVSVGASGGGTRFYRRVEVGK